MRSRESKQLAITGRTLHYIWSWLGPPGGGIIGRDMGLEDYLENSEVAAEWNRLCRGHSVLTL